MKHIIKIQEICQCNRISRENAELIIQEIQNAFNKVHEFIFEVVLSFDGITSISLEAASIIRNYIFDNKLEKSIYLIKMTPYVRQVFFHNSKTAKETNENDMNNTDQKELSKFGKKFLDFMNNQGGAKTVIIFGLTSLAVLLGSFFVHVFNFICSDIHFASKVIVIFVAVCVIIALVCLINVIFVANKQTKTFK